MASIGPSSRVPSMNLSDWEVLGKDVDRGDRRGRMRKATILAASIGAMNGLVLAAGYPERVRNLVIVNGAARTLWAPDYPVGSETVRTSPFTTVALEPDAVEQGFDVLRLVAPSVADDDAFRLWWDLAGNRRAPRAWPGRCPGS